MIQIQRNLRMDIDRNAYNQTPKFVAGVDLAYKGQQAIAVIVVMETMTQEIVEVKYALDKVSHEYVPGFLAFRELPIFLQAWDQLEIDPDLVFFDGNGILHPQRVGIATHASFFIEKPTIGIAKTYFLGSYKDPSAYQGSYEPIYDKDEMIGAVLRTQTNVKPVFVSIGNRVTLEEAIHWSMYFVGENSRIPEITRQPDLLSRVYLKQFCTE